MRGALEIAGFLALSAALHAGVALQWPQDGAGGQGAGGADIASLNAAPDSTASLVERWRTAPVVADGIADFGPPAPANVSFRFRSETAVQRPVSPPSNFGTPALDRVPDTPRAPPSASARPEMTVRPIAPAPPLAPGPAPTASSGPDTAPGRRPSAPPAQPDVARAPIVETTPADPPGSPLAAVASPRPDPRPTRPEPAAAVPPSAPNPAAPTRTQAPAPATAPAPTREAAGAGGGTTQGSAPRPAPAQPSLSAGERQSRMASWAGQIQRRIERSRPRVSGIGRVLLQLRIGRDGGLQGIGVARSSGDPAIDQAAVSAVRRAGRFPPAPDGLTEASYAFSLPIAFR